MLPEEFTRQPLGSIAHDRRPEPSGCSHPQAPHTRADSAIQGHNSHESPVNLCAVGVDPFEIRPSANSFIRWQPRVSHLLVGDGEALAPLGSTSLEYEPTVLG